jgi:asparagine synthase (glutamine-hydrolysing)
MLHLDVWWRGLNVLVDPGSYLYNGAAEWHDHFIETASHNTVVVDERDQMLHHRRFKTLYWTRARLLGFEDGVGHATCAGEHSGYQRHEGGVVHRRSVLFLKDDLWVVVDHLRGTGSHHARLHWLFGFPDVSYARDEGRARLQTSSGPFSLAVYDEVGRPLVGTVVSGAEHPPRGWLSRSYGERQATASLVVERDTTSGVSFVSVMGAGSPTLRHDGARWSVTHEAGTTQLRIEDGLIAVV